MILTYDNYEKFISSKKIKIGTNVEIGERTKILGVNGPAENVEIGDNVFLDRDIFIMTPQFKLGDYGKIFKNCRISGYKDCTIGHNFWCDQNTIINCTDIVEIRNNVGIGAYSQLWSHIKHGDVLEGCRFNITKPLLIEDDVWFVGHCIVSPIHAYKKSMAMVGSVVTKDMEENHIYGGCPAVDLTYKLGNQFIDRPLEEKISMMNTMLNKFFKAFSIGQKEKENIKIVDQLPNVQIKSTTYFNLNNRTYTKRLSQTEIDFMHFLLPLYKFVPVQMQDHNNE